MKERPSFSIRSRLTLGFLLLFSVSLAVTVTTFIIIGRIQSKLYFLEAAGKYSFEIQQARRFEKNYFLYRTNLKDALENVMLAQDILSMEGEKLAEVVGVEQFENMASHLNRYEELLLTLEEVDRNTDTGQSGDLQKIEAELREHGAAMVAVAKELLEKERNAVNSMLIISQRIPVISFAGLLVVMLYLAFSFAKHILQRLNRLMETTRRIAEGDFTPITPRRKYRDEFTELAMAMNHMMYQLDHRQELLAQSHKLKAIGTLTAGVAHELNNPINNIMLTASMLLEDYKELPEEERLDMINDLVEEAERSQKIVRNLLDFARESEIKTEALHVENLIEETLQLTNNQIKLANVKVRREFAQNLPPIHGDRQQLNQVLLNLILNALDSMPEGGSLVITTRLSKERDYVIMEIADTGHGIPEHVYSSIFDPFFTTKPNGKGTGLGLSVSLGIVRKHGGDITVRSNSDQGSIFTVLLPVSKIPAAFSR